jgi:predicted AlkP superfamily phosphohydrolase/phosphomutase
MTRGGAAIAGLLGVVLAVAPSACARTVAPGAGGAARTIVLGFDGLDYTLTRRLLDQGRLPNLARLARDGGFSPLLSTIPPQSPVAWSSFITGLDPGAHGIFDFMHRRPETMTPYLSTTSTETLGPALRIGSYRLPLWGGQVTLLRQGRPFWDALESQGVPTAILRMPANFPPSGRATVELSGMGTPDLAGSYGTFAFYTSEPFALAGRAIAGGVLHRVQVRDGVVHAAIDGPVDPLREPAARSAVPFSLHVDAPGGGVRLIVQDGAERVLRVGEWSDWVPLDFPLALTRSVRGMCRFYVKRITPHVELYASPVNLDPFAPALPISTPAGFAAELGHATGGRFYTQGMPEDTKSLSAGVLEPEAFLQQARLAAAEVRRQYRYALDRFDRGLLFYYVGNVDLVSHMMWRSMDPEHPAYDAARDAPYRGVIEALYVDLDGMVGETLDRIGPQATLVVMSDHGFASWRRAFHLNTWLEREGYLRLLDPRDRARPLLTNVDWARTRAYGLGLNGLYVNVRGRERHGIVDAAGRAALAQEIGARLRQYIDPATGTPAVTAVHTRDAAFAALPHPELAPDLIVGYAKGTRVSNQSALGEVPADVIVDNTDAWSGDHCMDRDAVPGVLFTSRPLRRRPATLQELAGAIVAELGVDAFPAPPR